MPRAENWVDQMWWSGYCDETVRFSSATGLDQEGELKRREWMEQHLSGCQDCRYANFTKNLEAKVAARLGMLEGFSRGEDVTKHPKFGGAVGDVMAHAMMVGQLDESVYEWMRAMAGRHGTPWPGHEQ